MPIFGRERTIIDSFRLLSQETAIKALKMALSSKSGVRLDLIFHHILFQQQHE